MDALLILAHGSPNPAANTELREIVALLQGRGDYALVQVGFLDCNEPDIPTAIDHCVAGGAQRIVAVPYFLHPGTHVCQDLPDLLRAGQQRHPSVTFRLAPYLGLSPTVSALLGVNATHAAALT